MEIEIDGRRKRRGVGGAIWELAAAAATSGDNSSESEARRREREEKRKLALLDGCFGPWLSRWVHAGCTVANQSRRMTGLKMPPKVLLKVLIYSARVADWALAGAVRSP